jgi:hypothetical protein
VCVHGLPLHGALDVMLRPHYLQARVEGGVIKVVCCSDSVPPARCGAVHVCGHEECEQPVVVCGTCAAVAHGCYWQSEADRKAKKLIYRGLMKACYLAVTEGEFRKAADFAHQAHAIDAASVEADPMVIRLDLLGGYSVTAPGHRVTANAAGVPAVGGGAEECEEAAPPKLVPHLPGVFENTTFDGCETGCPTNNGPCKPWRMR